MLFKGDDGITRRLGSGQRSNVYGKDPVRSVLDLTKCLRDRADLEYRYGRNYWRRVGCSRYAGYKVLVQYSSGSRHVTDM